MLTWLGAACLAATVPLSGVVVDAQGQPAAGVSVWLADTNPPQLGMETLAKAKTDDQGRFRLDRPDDLESKGAYWSPTLWAHRPGAHVARLEFRFGLPGADEPVRLELGPPASVPVRVLRPDGSPAVGVRVQPIQTHWENFPGPRPPRELFDHLAATTDAEGRAAIDGFTTNELTAVDVTVKDQLVQTLPLLPGTDIVALRPLGRLAVRIVGGAPEAPVQGWRVTASMRPADPNYGGPPTHWRASTTKADGRITFEPLAAGRVYWTIAPPKGSDYIVAKLPAAIIREGETTEAEILVLPGVRVEGVVRLAPENEPIPGVKVDLQALDSGPRDRHRIETDDQGRFSVVLPPGKARFDYAAFDFPQDIITPPGSKTQIEFTLEEGQKRFEIDPPALQKAAKVEGLVVDENDEPAVGASIEGIWRLPLPGGKGDAGGTVRVSADGRGRFELGRVPPGAEVRVSASRGWFYESDVVIIPKAGEGEPITLRLKKKPARAVSGRVLDANGAPVAGALVRIRLRTVSGPLIWGPYVFPPGEGEEIRTDADGRFQIPDRIPADMSHRIEASAEGWGPGVSPWLAPTDFGTPDARLRRLTTGDRELIGRVVDSFGAPIAGVRVFQASGDPDWKQGETDAEGRFALANFPSAPGLVLASKDDYRPLVRRVERGERSIELVLRTRAEAPPPPLRTVASPVSRDQERTITRELIAEARRLGPLEGRPGTGPIDEAEAEIDPNRVISLIENQARPPVAGLLEAVALGRLEEGPGAMFPVLEGIGDSVVAASVALNLFDRLGSRALPELRRELLERAERRIREVDSLVPTAITLVKIGERWFQLGNVERGAALLLEAQKLVDQERPDRRSSARDDLLAALWRLDLPEALRFWEADPDWRTTADWFKEAIAEREATTDLEKARQSADALQVKEPWGGLRRIRLRLAETDLEGARSLTNGYDDPLTDALLPAIAAKAQAETDPSTARALLRESIDRLASLNPSVPGDASPAALIARLLPLATRLDPDRAPDYLWLALARRPVAPSTMVMKPMTTAVAQYFLDWAELAALVAQYDRATAEIILAPVMDLFDNFQDADDFRQLGNQGVAAIAAIAAHDARVAKELLEAIPDAPPQGSGEPRSRYNHKPRARVAMIRILGLPPSLRLRGPLLPGWLANDWVAAIE